MFLLKSKLSRNRQDFAALDVCDRFHISTGARQTGMAEVSTAEQVHSLPRLPFLFPIDKTDDELEMTMVCHRPEGLEQLEAQTNFTKQELQILYRGFKNVICMRSSLVFEHAAEI